ncbi:actin cytoskeleton-regulatory complex protein PAN1 [Drosophila miranda]|uniref:actin cytoskeleton-regulatory complex protein PAN1 n=1 Tax=Drosophila miranda TaxID=7229 RepID=UPI0007E7502B|nr:actin cytoskeleton-regulatory complex protein PAN1 [Drosophila miranda]XP_017150785.1 actin cytoskeleton-regulatory complex protein PAN1 [Drosophila miranda]
MWQKQQQTTLLAATLIGICSVLASIQPTSSTSDLPQTLQPPTQPPQNVATTTEGAVRVVRLENDDEALSDSAKELNKQAAGTGSGLEVIEDLNYGSEVDIEEDTDSAATSTPPEKQEEFVGVPGFLPTVLPPPTNGHGYIQFEINDEMPVEAVRRRRPIEQTVTQSRTETVNEVLSNLFPNGFSDIFRFSGRDTSTNTEPATTTATTTNKAVVRPTVDAAAATTEATSPSTEAAATDPVAVTVTAIPEERNQTYFSYQTTVTKEYRRELRPGHTEIVVEKITRSEPSGGEHPFRDGSNHISRDELLRINRAAVAAPVLPSLLLLPESDDNETLVAAESAPIVILGEHETELDEGQDFEDNQIAETRHAARGVYQQRLPPPASHNGIESYTNRKGPGQEQEINVHIVHDDTLAKAQEGGEKPQAQQSLDIYQTHGEQRFPAPTQEAPSRQFLKSFNPIISGSGDGPIAKGTFHYEAGSPPQLPSPRPQQEADYAAQFVRPAGQLSYQQEYSHGIPQLPQLPESPQFPEPPQQQHYQQELHTQAIPSAAAPPQSQPPPEVQHYSAYGGPTPNSLVFVTLNTPPPPAPPQAASSPAPAQASASQDAAVEITVHHPAPHEYEAAAEPSQQHVRHVAPPHPKPDQQAPVESKPNGYTFVEVQKSVNIHNKLITEKDGRLVEQHETIYHQPYEQNQNHLSPFPAPATAPGKGYPSLTTNPINVEQVEHESSPQEVAVSHAEINQETGHHSAPGHQFEAIHPPSHSVPEFHPPQHYHEPPPHHVAVVEKVVPQPYLVEKHVDRPVKQFVEKHIPVPYAVHQPVPVPVHVEHYVDRPYPVPTFVEHPVPYPVETVVEKIVEKHVPVEVERIVERPVEVEKIVEKFVDRPMAIPIHVPVAIHMPMPPSHSPHSFGHPHPNALHPWSHSVAAHIPPKVLQNYYTRMLKKLLPQITQTQSQSQSKATQSKSPVKSLVKPPVKPVRGEAPPVATFSLADMRYDLRPPPPPQGSPWLQGARYIYNTLPADLATAAASAPAQMVKSYIGPVPGSTNAGSDSSTGNEFDEFQRWRNGHSLKRSPDFGRNLHMEYGFKPPLVPSMEIDDKGNPLKQEPEAETR